MIWIVADARRVAPLFLFPPTPLFLDRSRTGELEWWGQMRGQTKASNFGRGVIACEVARDGRGRRGGRFLTRPFDGRQYD